MSRVSFTSYARQDLEDIFRYIAQDNTAAAARQIRQLQARWRSLLDQPRMGTKRDELEPTLRSVTEGNYVIYYRTVPEGIELVRVLHTSRDSRRAFNQMKE